MNGNAKASINCLASEIKLVHSKKAEGEAVTAPAAITEPVEDLPF
jgi:hypothetical protein